MGGYRYVLELLDGSNLDPMMFVTKLDGWQVGDTVLAGPELQRYRVLAIECSVT